ncbi:MAG TPA: PilZ domain-containing protein [Tepidisphaeraceae bacterium]|jgi:hypothetical protein
MALSQQELIEILQRFESTPDSHEVRRSVRVAVRRHVTILTDPEARAGETEVVLQDISRGGVRLTHHEAMPRGRRFLLLLPGAAGSMGLPCVVRHCEMVKQHLFRIGAEFEVSEG